MTLLANIRRCGLAAVVLAVLSLTMAACNKTSGGMDEVSSPIVTEWANHLDDVRSPPVTEWA
jgi:predicted small secreted protein